MSEPRDEIAEVLAKTLYEHSAASTFDSTCGTCVREREHAHSLSGPLLDWLAERDRRVAGATLREAAAACRRMADQAEVDAGGKLDRWDAFAEAEDWCLLRAERIAEGHP